jgi:hypothetical protein
MKEYKIFARKLLLFICIIILFDFIIGAMLHWLYFRQKSGLLYRATYSMEKTNAGGLIFGSSRANHHYEPEVFKERLGLNFYNAGRDGNSIFYHYAVLKAVLKRYRPKMIVLDLNPQEFIVNKDSYDRLSSLFPYYKSHPEIRPVVNLKSPLEKYKMYSGIYPFNSFLLTILIGNLDANKERTQDIEGYIPLNNHLTHEIKTNQIPVTYETDSFKINVYKLFIAECKKFKVDLYIAASPNFIKSGYTDYSIRLGQGIAEKMHIPFYDFSRDSLFLNRSWLFSDPGHLNNDGAKLFSNNLIDSIQASGSKIALMPE